MITMNDYHEELTFDQTSFSNLLPLRPSEFINCSFKAIDFSNQNFKNSKFLECQFIDCNLSNVTLINAALRETLFIRCKLVGINWAETQSLISPDFKECVLDYGVFQAMKLVQINFTQCSIKDVDFFEANLSNANFSESILSGTTFNKGNLTGADFRGALDYYIDPRVTNIKKARFNLPEALSLLSAMEIIIE